MSGARIQETRVSVATSQSTAFQQLLRPDKPVTTSSRLKIVAAFAVMTLAAHVISGGRWTSILAGATGILFVLTFIPKLSTLVRPVAAYAGVWFVFNILRAKANETPWAGNVMGLVPRLEEWLAGGRLPTAILQDAFYDGRTIDRFDYAWTTIYLSFFIVPHLAALLLLWRNRLKFWRYVVASAVLFTLALAFFFIIPTSPPWMVTQAVPGANFAEMWRITEDVLVHMDLPVKIFSDTETDGMQTREVRMEPNPIAAMPSIHFASTALLAFAARGSHPVILGTAVIYTALMGAALVYMGEHYVLDLAVGGILVATGWAVACRYVYNVPGEAGQA